MMFNELKMIITKDALYLSFSKIFSFKLICLQDQRKFSLIVRAIGAVAHSTCSI